MKCRVPPGRSTRRSSAKAPPMSGIVHMVHADTAQSNVSSLNGSACPSRPARSHEYRARGDSGLSQLPPDVRRFDGGHA